jgi:hypothetical protein
MATLTEGMHEGEFIGQLAMGIGYHVDEVTLKSGQNLAAGRVVALETGTSKYVAYDNASGTAGINVVAGILIGAVNATAGDITNARVLRRGPALVNANDLGWGANDATGVTAGKADLLTLGIKAV